MEKRFLFEIAREFCWPPDVDVPVEVIDRALTEAGFDTGNQNERDRFRNLVAANYHHQAADELGEYLDDARQEAGPDATDSEIYGIAWGMKQNADQNAEQWRRETEHCER